MRGSTHCGNRQPRKTWVATNFRREALLTCKSRRTRDVRGRPKISPSPLQAPLHLTGSRGRMAETRAYLKRQMLLSWEPLRDVVHWSYKYFKVLCSSVESELVWKTTKQQLTTYILTTLLENRLKVINGSSAVSVQSSVYCNLWNILPHMASAYLWSEEIFC